VRALFDQLGVLDREANVRVADDTEMCAISPTIVS
jgi:hypothetical protein